MHQFAHNWPVTDHADDFIFGEAWVQFLEPLKIEIVNKVHFFIFLRPTMTEFRV